VEANGTEEDRPQNIDVFGVQIVPNLTIAVESTTTINVNIVTTELEESGSILEGLVKCVLLPVIRVVGELNCALNVCSFYQLTTSLLRGGLRWLTKINMVEECKIKCGTNGELLIFWKDNMAAIVARFDGFQDACRVICSISTRLDGAYLRPLR
jgi:hypothetical protein